MQYPLIQFEQFVKEDDLVSGELLFESGGVQQIQEIEKHLWLAAVQDEGQWEAEISISPSKVIQTTCDCSKFQAVKSCPHIVAALFALRKRLQEQKQKKSGAEKPAKKSLNTVNILSHIRVDDLKEFVEQYARHNRSFAVALKTRFAQDIPAADNQAKFIELLDSAVSLSRKPDRSFGSRGIKKIIQVLREVHQQIQRAIALSHYADAADMSISIIEKISPLARKAGELQDELKKIIEDTIDFLQLLAQRDISPDLRDSIWHYTLESSSKLVHRNNQTDLLLFKILRQLADSPEKVSTLTALIKTHLQKYHAEGRNAAGLVLFQMQILEKQGKALEAGALVKEYLFNPEVLMFVIKQSAEKEDWPQVVRLAEEGLKLDMPTAVQHELYDILLQESIRVNNLSQTYTLALNRFMSRLDIKYYHIARTAMRGQWDNQPDAVLSKLQVLPFSAQKRKAIAGVLSAEARQGELMAYLQQARSLDLTVEFGTTLPAPYKEEVQQLILALIAQFLRGHAGPKPSQHIRELIDKIHQSGAHELASSLAKQLKHQYPERHTLQEELQLY